MEVSEAGWRVSPYSNMVSLKTPGGDQWVIPTATARALASGLVSVANKIDGLEVPAERVEVEDTQGELDV